MNKKILFIGLIGIILLTGCEQKYRDDCLTHAKELYNKIDSSNVESCVVEYSEERSAVTIIFCIDKDETLYQDRYGIKKDDELYDSIYMNYDYVKNKASKDKDIYVYEFKKDELK
jgi:hypothetical protein